MIQSNSKKGREVERKRITSKRITNLEYVNLLYSETEIIVKKSKIIKIKLKKTNRVYRNLLLAKNL